MRHARVRLPAFVLILMVLVLPSGLSAKEKRGAKLIVTRLDGRQAAGELLAVRPTSLLLMGFAAREESVDLADIRTVRIVRKSHTGLITLVGFLAGAVAGGVWLGGDPEIESGALIGGGLGGAAGAAAGLGISLGVGVDAVFAVAGEPEEVVRKRLDKLRGYSREGRVLGFESPEETRPRPAPPAAVIKPVAPAPQPPRTARRSKFRIGLATTLSFGGAWGQPQPAQGSFRFPGDVPQDEAGPHPVTFSQYRMTAMNEWAVLGPVSLAYEWGGHWSSEIEVFLMGPGSAVWGEGPATFTSTTEGKTYETNFGFSQRAGFDSLLIGLNYRPIAPTKFDRTVIEAGVAVGPAWVRIAANSPFLQAGRKVVLSARAQVTYDYYFVPAFSLGVFAGYRYLEASFPGATGTGDWGFTDVADEYPYEDPLIRLTEVTFPGRTVSRSGLTYGVRIGFRI